MSNGMEFQYLVYKAKLAEQVERYDEMVMSMEEVVKQKPEKTNLSSEERNLLSVAYKNTIGSRRAAWRTISSIEEKEERGKTDSEQKLSIIKKYKTRIENEMDEIIRNILHLLDSFLLSDASLLSETKAFYYKIKGDYCRYMAEYKTGEARDGAVGAASEAYKEAQRLATTEDGEISRLKSTQPIRLGIALNYSVFYHEILHKPVEACELAKKAIDVAIADLDNIDEDSYKDSVLIIALMRDNIFLWPSEMQDEDGQVGGGQGDQ